MRFRPMREIYRRPGRTPGNAAHRYWAIGGAEVLAIGKKVRMRIKVGAGRSIGSRVFDLLIDRVCINHNPDWTEQMLFAQFCCTAEVDNAVGPGVERLHAVA